MIIKDAYSPYGYHGPSHSVLGYNGERADPVTGHYHLGNGYRAYNHVLMSFNSPDSLSPFAQSCLNAYAYCKGDPVNFLDPSGHVLEKLLNLFSPAARAPSVSRNVLKTLANTRPDHEFTQEIGVHATHSSNVKSFKVNGIRPDKFSEPGRQKQGKNLYFASEEWEVEPYVKEYYPNGIKLKVLVHESVTLEPGEHYTSDGAGRYALQKLGWGVAILRETAPANSVKIKLTPAPYEVYKKKKETP